MIFSTCGVSARAFLRDAAAVDTQAFTSSATLAAVLKDVMYGDIDLFTDPACTKEAQIPLGGRLSGTQYFVKDAATGYGVGGWLCFIYAQAVYNKLFGERLGNATNLRNSEIKLRGLSRLDYATLSGANVRSGAYIRTTPKSDGSFYTKDGHSMIILCYDAESITYLEGNADNNGLVRIAIDSWSEFNAGELSGRGRKLCHVIQPKDAHYDSLYNAPPPPPPTDPTLPFTDVFASAWYTKNQSVRFAYNNGLLKGISDTEFAPDANVTRAMFVTVLGRLAGVSKHYTGQSTFSDVEIGCYYTPYVMWAEDNDIVEGFADGTFLPEAAITREQICKLMVKYCKYADVALPDTEPKLFIDDADISGWAYKYVYICQGADLINGEKQGNGYLFSPRNCATRAQVATILMNYIKKYI